MAYDEGLADRIRDALGPVDGVRERKMFGGLAFMVAGNMACGIVGDELMLRLGDEGADAALDRENVRPMDFTGRPMHSMVFVSPAGVAADADLRAWVGAAVTFVRTLPAKRDASASD